MNPASRFKNKLEVEFLKTKTYEEINDIINEFNNKLVEANTEISTLKAEIERLRESFKTHVED